MNKEMSIQEKIKQQVKEAIKKQDFLTSNNLKVILGEFDRFSKKVTDDEAIQMLRKMKKDAVKAGDKLFGDLVDNYLPKLMSKEEISKAVDDLIKGGINHVGKLMGAFNKTFKGKADNTVVKSIIVDKLKD